MNHGRVFLVALLMTGCASTATMKQESVADLRAVPKNNQSEAQRQSDWGECLDKTVSGQAFYLGGVIRLAVERSAFKDCLNGRGYVIEDNPDYKGIRR